MKRTIIMAIMAVFATVSQSAVAQTESPYVDWGVDEFEFFGMTKAELSNKFKNKLSFSKDFSLAKFGHFQACNSYDGATFRLRFSGDRVTEVQRVFAGCKSTQEGPVFRTKREALNFAIAGQQEREQRGVLKLDETKRLNNARRLLKALEANPKL